MPAAEESPARYAADQSDERDEPRTLRELTFQVGGVLHPLLQLIQIAHELLTGFKYLPPRLRELFDVVAGGSLRQVACRHTIRVFVLCRHTRVNPARCFAIHSYNSASRDLNASGSLSVAA